jgi:anti-sigma factor RsiW
VTCPHATDVGAYVIDALEPQERQGVRAHLEVCPACAAEVRDLAGLPALLATVPPPGPALPPPEPSEVAFLRLRRSAAVAPPPHRAPPGTPRRWLLVAAAVVVLGASGVTAAVAVRDRTAPTTVAVQSGQMAVRASIAAAGAGSRITLALEGMPSGHRCELTVEARDGHWETASVWTADYEGEAHVSGAVGIRPADLRLLVIRSSDDGRTLLTMKP